MNVTIYPYQLQFRYPFRIAHGVRTHTDAVYVKLEQEGFKGWGEATLPPYLPETQKSVMEFIDSFCKSFSSDDIEEWFERVSAINACMPAKAALDEALWGLKTQIENKSIAELFGIETKTQPYSFYTIGAGSKEEMRKKITFAQQNGFEQFKLKLTGSTEDYQTIENFISFLPSADFAVDMNCAYTDINTAEKFVCFLKNKNCVLIEQPMAKHMLAETAELRQRTGTIFFADESCQDIHDLEKISKAFGGVNIKLLKCGGISEGYRMIQKAKAMGMKVLIGSMSESSVGCTAAAHLAPLCDFADLDGPYLNANDPFEGMRIRNGKIETNPLQQLRELS